MQLHAWGVQIYDCKPGRDDATRLEWAFGAPQAKLLGPSGTLVGTHYAGPTWESADGSTVVAAVVARDNGPDATAIPWLPLRASSATGPGIFAQVQSIQRLQTVGGKAPAEGCAPGDAGEVLRVP
jgi:FtsP/CotA-like multicopper oxidase with cupredoxin domain